ncbi:MAG TPA: hypothetical protein DDY58_02200 [Terrisporobacter glycolicus]|uniref:Uncharacterized protein n=1 Tax=Terrisporobacter hibernicus TaxID=2813371 RepID=A0AAX2ZFK4_9FIRM|nr:MULTISPECIES: DUF6483 family protein [Terrisporobacter]MBN9645843.1 hypothetical protein [Terrisporobacter glycolicus]MCC3865159.1 hypothetical protein [Terrisporobacter petrolearius]UEL47515.1 hypothetical protein JW646_18125 [Terrisporobacter hibernicus]UPA28914.1 DUF6483 family protein [Terrisporobacter glycolicus]SFJ16817.1 hypothetical protein SAMN02910355_1334 [Terrisporobacter glycolicus]
MELEKDYILRMVKDLVKSIAHIVLGKSEMEYELPENDEYSRIDYLYVRLLELVNQGKINDAEDMLFDEINTSDMKQFEMAMSFYLYLNDFGDDYLESNDYSRDEISEGIKSICKEYGVSSMVEFLF